MPGGVEFQPEMVMIKGCMKRVGHDPGLGHRAAKKPCGVNAADYVFVGSHMVLVGMRDKGKVLDPGSVQPQGGPFQAYPMVQFDHDPITISP